MAHFLAVVDLGPTLNRHVDQLNAKMAKIGFKPTITGVSEESFILPAGVYSASGLEKDVDDLRNAIREIAKDLYTPARVVVTKGSSSWNLKKVV